MGVFGVIRHAFSIDIPLHVAGAQDNDLAMVNTGDVVLVDDDETAEFVEEEEDDIQIDTQSPDEAVTDSTLLAGGLLDKESATDSTSKMSDADGNGALLFVNDTRKHHPIRGVWSYDKCFPDVQDIQIVAAMKNGVKPAKDRDEADRYVQSRKLVNVNFSPYYSVDKLTHSMPYLVPKAQQLLNTIAINFIDSCQVKGLPPHKIIVTSILRTTDDVKSLQKGNGNATTNSCHCYGTTVDIAYNKFVPVTGTYNKRTPLLRWDEPMKQVLSEVLDDLRQQEKIYVKYEVKQGCYHLTCR